MARLSKSWHKLKAKVETASISGTSYDPTDSSGTMTLHFTRFEGDRVFRFSVELTRDELAFVDRARMGAAGTARDVEKRIVKASVAAEHMRPLAALGHEEFWAVLLTARLDVVKAVLVAQGGVTQCSIKAADAFRPAVVEQAPAVIFVHNHPSGDPSPSPDDQRLQLQLDEAGHALGVRVVDHVVIAQAGFHSAVEGRHDWRTE